MINEEIMNSKTLIKIDNLSIHFRTYEGKVQALDSINLDLNEGEILGIIGESGSGKSTTALSLLGLLPDNAEVTGSVAYLDKSIINSKDTVNDRKLRAKARLLMDQRLAEIRWREISMIFQGAMNAFNPVHTIRDQIKEVFEIHNTFADISNYSEKDFIDEGNLRARANELALEDIKDKESAQFKIIEQKIYEELVEKLKSDLQRMSPKHKRKLLENNRMESSCRKSGFNPKFLDAYPHELSGGMKQRGIIAMALALNPKVVIADEPTTGLDVITQAKIIKELKGLKDSKTIRSMIVISHDVGVVSQLANYVAVMYAGRVMEYGEPKDIFVNPRNPYTYALMHSYPSIDATKQRIHGIPGSVPDLIDPPKGCYFAGRCFMAQDICHEEKPSLRNLSQDHKSLCHFDDIDEEKYLQKQRYNDELLQDQSAVSRPVLLEAREMSKYFSVHSNLTTNLFGGANKPVVHAVDKVNLLIRKKVIIGVVGESGSGKTTLGKLLVNAIESTNGKLIFRFDQVSGESIIEFAEPDSKEGELSEEEIRERKDFLDDIARMSKLNPKYKIYRKESQLIFQDPYDSINPKMSIFDIVAEPLIIQRKELIKRRKHGSSDASAKGNGEATQEPDSNQPDSSVNLNSDIDSEEFDLEKEVYSALNIANLRPPEHYVERYPHELSGGERQRVSIARSITLNPSFLVADEPISMLDVSIRANIMNLLLELKEKRDISVLYISHDIASARYVSDFLVVMYLGQIVELGKSEEIIREPLHPYTKALISAVPSLDPTWVNKGLDIVGEIGSAINPPKGCRFYGRCVYHKDICKEEDPPLQEIGNRSYSCHFAQDELTLEETMEEIEGGEEGSHMSE